MFKLKLQIIMPILLPCQPPWSRCCFCRTLYYTWLVCEYSGSHYWMLVSAMNECFIEFMSPNLHNNPVEQVKLTLKSDCLGISASHWPNMWSWAKHFSISNSVSTIKNNKKHKIWVYGEGQIKQNSWSIERTVLLSATINRKANWSSEC